jgi:hypothetical protein
MKIAHVITDLNVGGAQVMLHQLSAPYGQDGFSERGDLADR